MYYILMFAYLCYYQLDSFDCFAVVIRIMSDNVAPGALYVTLIALPVAINSSALSSIGLARTTVATMRVFTYFGVPL